MTKAISKVTDAVGLTDTKAGSGAMQAAQQQQAEVLRRLDAVNLPDIDKMRIALEMPELVGQLEAEDLGPSALESISLDPQLREAQMSALSEMRELAEQGLSEGDLAAARMLRRDVAADNQARQAQILDSMEQRGTLDSGLALAAQLDASQRANQEQMEGADRLAMQAAENRRNALLQQSSMASNIRGADYSQAADAARARDVINQFNVQNRADVGGRNLAAKQSVSDQQTALRNQQQMYNKGLEQQQFENKLRKAGAAGGALNNMAATSMAQGQAQAQAANQFLPAAGNILGGISKFR